MTKYIFEIERILFFVCLILWSLNTSLVWILFGLAIPLNNKCKIVESNWVQKLFIKWKDRKNAPFELEDMEYLRIINQFMCIEYQRRRSWKVNREPIKKGMECWVCLLGLPAAFAIGALHKLHTFSYIRYHSRQRDITYRSVRCLLFTL